MATEEIMTAQEMAAQLGLFCRNNPQAVTKQLSDLIYQFNMAVRAGNVALYQQIYQQIYSLLGQSQSTLQSLWQSVQPYAAQAFAFVGLLWSAFSDFVASLMADIIATFFAYPALVGMLCIITLVLIYYLLIEIDRRKGINHKMTYDSKLRVALNDPNYGPVVAIQTRRLPPSIRIAGFPQEA